MNSLKDQYKASVNEFCDENIKLLPMQIAQASENTSIIIRKNKKNRFKSWFKGFLPFMLILILILGFILVRFNTISSKQPATTPTVSYDEIHTDKPVISNNKPASYEVQVYYPPVRYPHSEYREEINVTLSDDKYQFTLVDITGTLVEPMFNFELEILDSDLNDLAPTLQIGGRTLSKEIYDNAIETALYSDYEYNIEKSYDGKYYFSIEGYELFMETDVPFIFEIFSISYTNGEGISVTENLDFEYELVSEIAEYFPRIINYFDYSGKYMSHNGVKYYFTYLEITSYGAYFSFRYDLKPAKRYNKDGTVIEDNYKGPGVNWNEFIDSLTMNVDGTLYKNINRESHAEPYYDSNQSCYFGTAWFPGIDVTAAKNITLEYKDITAIQNEVPEANPAADTTQTNNEAANTTTPYNVSVQLYIKLIVILILVIAIIVAITLATMYLPMKYTLEKIKNDYYSMYHEHAVGYNSNTFNNRVSSLQEIDYADGIFAIETDAKKIKYSGFDVTSDGLIIQRLSPKEKLFELCHPDDPINPTVIAGLYHVTLYSGEVIDCYINDQIVDIPAVGYFVLPIGRLTPDGAVDCFSDFIKDKYEDGTIDTNMKLHRKLSIVLFYLFLFIYRIFNRHPKH